MNYPIGRTLSIVFALAIGAASPSHAGPVADYAKAAGLKLGHGLINLAYAPVDVLSTPVAMGIAWDRDGRAPAGFVLGAPVGLVNGQLRAGLAIWDVLTFPLTDGSAERRFNPSPFLTGWDPMHAPSDPFAAESVLRPALQPTAAPVRIPSRD